MNDSNVEYKTLAERVGKRVREIRNHYSETQKEFGKRFGIKAGTNTLEQGTSALAFNHLHHFKKIGVNFNWLLYGVGEMFLSRDYLRASSIVSELEVDYSSKNTLVAQINALQAKNDEMKQQIAIKNEMIANQEKLLSTYQKILDSKYS